MGGARSAGRPAGAARAPRARPGRPCWLDLASIGSLRLPLAPLLARFGLVWLDLAAPAALAGSIWLLCALLGAPAGSIWLPTTTPSTRLAKKKRFAYRRSCFDAACFVRSGTFLHASNLVNYILKFHLLPRPPSPRQPPPQTTFFFIPQPSVWGC